MGTANMRNERWLMPLAVIHSRCRGQLCLAVLAQQDDLVVELRCLRVPALAPVTYWNPTGWHSAMFDPSITMQPAFCRSCWNVAPPRPKLIPKLGTWRSVKSGPGLRSGLRSRPVPASCPNRYCHAIRQAGGRPNHCLVRRYAATVRVFRCRPPGPG